MMLVITITRYIMLLLSKNWLKMPKRKKYTKNKICTYHTGTDRTTTANLMLKFNGIVARVRGCFAYLKEKKNHINLEIIQIVLVLRDCCCLFFCRDS